MAIMMDTEGSEIHMGDLGGEASAKAEDGEEWTFTVRKMAGERTPRTVTVNYDGFVDGKTGWGGDLYQTDQGGVMRSHERARCFAFQM